MQPRGPPRARAPAARPQTSARRTAGYPQYRTWQRAPEETPAFLTVSALLRSGSKAGTAILLPRRPPGLPAVGSSLQMVVLAILIVLAQLLQQRIAALA